MTLPKLPLGQVVATPGALAAWAEAGQTPQEFIRRHIIGDWGELDDHDRAENERSLQCGCRLLPTAPEPGSFCRRSIDLTPLPAVHCVAGLFFESGSL